MTDFERLHMGEFTVDTTAELAKRLAEAMKVLDVMARAADGDQSAALDIRLRPSVTRRWNEQTMSLLAHVGHWHGQHYYYGRCTGGAPGDRFAL